VEEHRCFFLLIYGMSLGAVLTHQKKTYYYITLVLNGTLLIAGISLMVIYGSKLIKSLNQDYIILIALFLMLILTPILNLIFIKTKMIVLNRMSLRKESMENKNLDTTLEWPDTVDGDVFRRMKSSAINFAIEHKIRF